MTRPARARVDLDAIRHNLGRARENAPGARVMAVVKADADGHGAAPVARAIDVDAYGVARVHEGIALREAGVDPEGREAAHPDRSDREDLPEPIHRGPPHSS